MDNKPTPSVEETMSTSGIPKDAMTAGHTKGATEEQGRIIPEDAVKDAMIVKDTSKDGIMCSKDVPKNAMTAKATTEGEGTLSFIDVRKNAMAAKVVSEQGAQSQPSSGRPKTGLHLFFMNIRDVFKCDSLGSEIARIAIPAAPVLAADPLALVVDTALIGRIGSVELAAVGVSIAIFNQVSKVAIYPLVSVTTSFVAEEDAICSEITESKENEDLEKNTNVNNEMRLPSCYDPVKTEKSTSCITSICTNSFTSRRERRYIPSVSSALVVGAILGFLQAILLVFGGKIALRIMGVTSDSPMLPPAHNYLTIRSLGAPAVLLSEDSRTLRRLYLPLANKQGGNTLSTRKPFSH